MNAIKQKWFEGIQESALCAAHEVFGRFSSPPSISQLKLRPNRDEAVLSWLMDSPGRNGFEIVAKRGKFKKIHREHLLYTKVLPRLGLESLQCFGAVKETDSPFAWIFIEHAGNHLYRSDIPEHVDLAAKWLSKLHAGQLDPEQQELFPKRGDEHYASCLHAAHPLLENGIMNPALSGEQRLWLSRMLRVLERLEKKWIIVQELCSTVPRCLIHGDFLSKNLRIHLTGSKLQLKVFDLDAACWGFPFLDLAESLLPTHIGLASEVDADLYLKYYHKYRPDFGTDELHRLTGLGNIFWALNCIRGHAEGLQYEWVDKAISNIKIYHEILEHGLKQAKL